MKKTLIFVRMEKPEVPAKFEGIFIPTKFETKQYLSWKHNSGDRRGALERLIGDEFSLIEEIYEAIEQNFISAIDRQYMLWANYLTDPKVKTGATIIEANGTRTPSFRRPSDSEIRFSGPRRDLFTDFIAMIRAMVVTEPVVAPKYVVEALNLPKEVKSNEFSCTTESIAPASWKKLYHWSVLRSFIDGRVKEFPSTEELIEMYGDKPDDGETHITESILKYDGCYVDLLDPEESLDLVLELRMSGLKEEDVVVYDVQI